MSDIKQYRWWLILYHCQTEVHRSPGDRWFASLVECKKDAEQQDFDYCCGYNFEFEERVKHDGD